MMEVHVLQRVISEQPILTTVRHNSCV